MIMHLFLCVRYLPRLMQLSFWGGVMQMWNLRGGFQTGEQKNFCSFVQRSPIFFPNRCATHLMQDPMLWSSLSSSMFLSFSRWFNISSPQRPMEDSKLMAPWLTRLQRAVSFKILLACKLKSCISYDLKMYWDTQFWIVQLFVQNQYISSSAHWSSFTPLFKVCAHLFVSAFMTWVTEFFFLVCRFIKGLPVNKAILSEELKQAIGLEPMPKGISYVISTKVNTYTLM